MNDIYKYLLKYGEKTLQENELNEIDIAIFSQISYIDFKGMIDNGEKKRALMDVGHDFFSHFQQSIHKRSINLFKMMMNLPRYKDLYLSNYFYKISDDEQCGAFTIDTEGIRLVVYKGTDSYLSGWKEDFSFFYQFPTPAQSDAIEYLNKVAKRSENLIVLGHSKGGHLSLIASMYANLSVKRKIKAIYSFDGPGVRKEQYLSRKYKSIKDKYIKYIPKYSVIGRLLYDDLDEIIVDCKDKFFLSHHVLCWKIEDKKFIRSELSKISKDTFYAMNKWVEKYNDQELRDFTHCLFKIFDDAGIKKMDELKKLDVEKIKLMILGIKNVDPIITKMLGEFIMVMEQYYLCNKIKDSHHL